MRAPDARTLGAVSASRSLSREAVAQRLQALRGEMAELVAAYHEEAHAPEPFVPGETPVLCAGRVFDERDMQSLMDATLDFWLTTGRFAATFERRFADWFGLRHCMLVNSGSSANLAALSALTSPKLGARALRPGDEVITTATSFPTTVNPILQAGLVPVFLDVDVPTYNLDPSRPARGDLRRPRHRVVLSRPPHHDGRGRGGADPPRAAEGAGGVLPRL